MKKIAGIVFDFGGVISAPQDASFFPAVEALTGWDKATVLAGWKRHRLLMDADTISVRELYRRIAADHKRALSEACYDRLAQLDFDSWAIPNPATLAWAKTLKAQGYKIGILTNMPTDFIPWFDRCAAEFRALADAEVISGAERIVKPDPTIYALMAKRLALDPEEHFFLDDTQANVDAARQAGWFAHRFTTPEDAADALQQLTTAHT